MRGLTLNFASLSYELNCNAYCMCSLIGIAQGPLEPSYYSAVCTFLSFLWPNSVDCTCKERLWWNQLSWLIIAIHRHCEIHWLTNQEIAELIKGLSFTPGTAWYKLTHLHRKEIIRLVLDTLCSDLFSLLDK